MKDMRNHNRRSTCGVWKHGAWFCGVKGSWTGPALCGATAEEETSAPLLTTGVTKLRKENDNIAGAARMYYGTKEADVHFQRQNLLAEGFLQLIGVW